MKIVDLMFDFHNCLEQAFMILVYVEVVVA